MNYEFVRKEIGMGNTWICHIGTDIEMRIQHNQYISDSKIWKVSYVRVGSHKIITDSDAPYILTNYGAAQRAIDMMNMLYLIIGGETYENNNKHAGIDEISWRAGKG